MAIVGGLVASGIGADLTAKISAQVSCIGGGADCGDSGGGDDEDTQAGGAAAGGTGGGGDQRPASTEKTQAEKDYEAAVKELDEAEGDYEKEKKRAVEAAKKLSAILAEELGITDAVKCFTEGDPSSCTETAINVVLALVGSLPAKVLKKYGWPTKWKKGKEVVESIVKHGGDVVGGGKGMWKAKKKADQLRKKVDNLKQKLPKREKKPEGPEAGRKPKEKDPACPVNHSFLPGTPVLLADGTRRAIEDVRAGDRVLATDPVRGLTASRAVTDTITTEDDKDFTRLTLRLTSGSHSDVSSASGGSGTATLTATDTHPFWLVDEGRWADAGEIEEGAELRLPDGATVAVADVSRYERRQRTHDLTVESTHTYYVGVGSRNVLVHNNDCGPKKKRTQKELKSLAEGAADEARSYQDEFLREVRAEAKAKGKSPEEIEQAVEWAEKKNTTSVIRARFPVPGQPGKWVERNVVARSGPGLSPAQLTAAKKRGDVPVRLNAGGATHAEQNALLHINKLGGEPIAGGASRNVCKSTCPPLIRGSQGVVSGEVTGSGGSKVRTFWWP
ncbi:polymorphic toxin-type HINT domain-containing protein [Streptomyces sp. JV176]|uniref:polymorphic toxin-type HINT domain-containing protein n=1 Tax=Streptomyces sp. JV176 TaxID=858630 RepID=UPI002E76CE48|nr:polymorphic toxin-type HINT domain-containing protein [Streptomyces sp. JV176]MEE1804244.1 polymorphic toxin-type HINT domain-containing protein [Streptomyces sp. JV176]